MNYKKLNENAGGQKLYRHNIKGSGSNYIYYFSLICNIQEEFTISSFVDYIRKEGDDILIYGYVTPKDDIDRIFILLRIVYFENTGLSIRYKRAYPSNGYNSVRFDTIETDKVYEL